MLKPDHKSRSFYFLPLTFLLLHFARILSQGAREERIVKTCKRRKGSTRHILPEIYPQRSLCISFLPSRRGANKFESCAPLKNLVCHCSIVCYRFVLPLRLLSAHLMRCSSHNFGFSLMLQTKRGFLAFMGPVNYLGGRESEKVGT